MDDLFKMQFWQWKFDVQQATERARVDDVVVDAPADESKEE